MEILSKSIESIRRICSSQFDMVKARLRILRRRRGGGEARERWQRGTEQPETRWGRTGERLNATVRGREEKKGVRGENNSSSHARMLGFGPELEDTVMDLTYNYGVTEYSKGDAYAQVAIGTDDVYKCVEVVKMVTEGRRSLSYAMLKFQLLLSRKEPPLKRNPDEHKRFLENYGEQLTAEDVELMLSLVSELVNCGL
ncbi:hypothetical protein Droror1_Dr00017948 [Drosera rotundifolia]